jgi:hypothetical protein
MEDAIRRVDTNFGEKYREEDQAEEEFEGTG